MAVHRGMKLLHLVNRTTRPLGCMWDGVPYKIYPGYVCIDSEGLVQEVRFTQPNKLAKELRIVPAKAQRDRRGHIIGFVPNLEDGAQPFVDQFEWAVARAACLQNKWLGSENPMDPREFESLCAVLEWENDADWIEQREEGTESLDRSMMPADAQNVRRIGQAHRSKKAKGKRRFRIEDYGGGLQNPTGMDMMPRR